MKVAFLSNPIIRGIIAVVLFIGAMAGTYAVLDYLNSPRVQTGTSGSSSGTAMAPSKIPKPSEVKGDELTKLNTVDRVNFCKTFPTKPTATVDPSEYQKLGTTKEQYLNLTLYCRWQLKVTTF